MRILLFAYHNIGYACMEELLKMKAEIMGVVTHEDDEGENVWFKSVAKLAAKKRIPVFKPEKSEIKTEEFLNIVRNLKPDLIFSFYYRHMIPETILNVPPKGAMNLHGSYLPAYRGRCPVNWVIINGEPYTGVSLHFMEKTPDSGLIVAQKKVAISKTDTAFTLFNKMEKAARVLMKKTYPLIVKGTYKAVPQDISKSSYFGGRKPEDGMIHWNEPAFKIYNLIRGVTHPYPGAVTNIGGKKLFIWQASVSGKNDRQSKVVPGTIVKVSPSAGVLVKTGKGYLLIKSLQFEGKGEIKEKQILRELKEFEGKKFS